MSCVKPECQKLRIERDLLALDVFRVEIELFELTTIQLGTGRHRKP